MRIELDMALREKSRVASAVKLRTLLIAPLPSALRSHVPFSAMGSGASGVQQHAMQLK